MTANRTVIIKDEELTRGQRIRKLRLDRGLTQLQLGQRIGPVSETVISRIERDYSDKMSYHMAEQLAKALGTSPEYILEGKKVSLDFMSDIVKDFICNPDNYLALEQFVLEEQLKRNLQKRNKE